MTTNRSIVSRNASKVWQGFIAMALVAAAVFSAPVATSASVLGALEATDVDISYSAAPDRSSPASLDGAAISGSVYTFVTPLEPDGDIKRVEFSLDGVSSNTEFVAPYDWPPRARGPWDSSSVTDGPHTLSIDVHLGDGSVVSKTVQFSTSNGFAPVDSGLAYSDDIGRSDNLDLNGAVVTGTVWAYVFPTHPARQLGIQNVSFTLDGSDFRTEYLPPYDFAPAAQGWDTTSVADGEHTIVATANGSDGTVFTSTATFTVANDGPPPTDPMDPDGEDPDGEDPDGEDPDGEDPDDSGEPFDAADGMVIGRTGTLNGLNGINVGPDGKVYVSSVAGNEITVHDPETLAILDRIGPERGVFGPDDLFVTADGTIYWTEILAGNVGMLKPDGTFKTQFVGPGVNPITMSDDGRLFVARVFLGDGLYELDPDLEADPIVLIPDIVSLNGMDFGPDGLLYGPLFFGAAVVRIDVDAATPAAEVVVDGLNVPAAVKFNSAGELHAAQIGGGNILKIDVDTGAAEVLAEIEGSIDNLAFDANDRLFFTAGVDNQIHRITPNGATEVFGDITLTSPGGIAVGPDGTVWVADLFTLRGFQEGPDPVASFYDRFPAPGTAFAGANSVSADGDLLVTSSTFGGNVQVLNPATGEVLEDIRNLVLPTNAIAHGDVLAASQLGAAPGDANVVDARTGDVLLAGLALPVGLASDGTTLYVGDWALGTITAVDAAGSAVVASGLTNPEGLAVDGDRLLVVEEGLDQVSAVELATGEITPVIVGLDLGPIPIPTFAPYLSPTGVAVDADGTIYVTQDGETNAALKFPAGPSDPDGEDPDGEGPTLSVSETLAADGRFSTLVELLGEATFAPPPPDLDFTVFAPTDDAFAALPEGVLDEIRANPDALNDALLYHVVEGNLLAEALATTPEIVSLTGAPIGVELVGDTIVLNGNVNVTEADILATDGVVHAVDAVLQPPQRDFLTFLVAEFARGSTEVPNPGDPASLSQGLIELFDVEGDDHELCINARTTVTDPTAAHIHAGAAGVAGDVVVDFGLDTSSWEPDEFSPTHLLAQTCVPVELGLAEQIAATPGDFYFNIHSETFPGGANREQLFDAEGLNFFPRAFTAAPLLGSNEVPGPGDPDSGRSFADFYLPTTDNDELCFQSAAFNIDPISAAHIHAGAAGTPGDVVVNLEVGSRWPVIDGDTGLHQFIEGCSPIDPAVQSQIEADPSAFYANIHNDAFPQGAVRAQLVAGMGEIPLIAPLEPAGGGSEEVNGFAGFVLFPEQGLLCWDIDTTGVGQPTGVSILGPGGMAIALDLATYPFQENAAPFGDLLSFGCQAVDQAVQEAMIAGPDAYSVSIDTADGAGVLNGPLFDPFTGPAGPPPDGEDPGGEDPDSDTGQPAAARAFQFSRLSGR